MIYYYKILDMNNNVIGAASSYALRYYDEKAKMILCCRENLAQYIYYDGTFYRIGWLNPENDIMKNTYPEAQALVISEEEFNQINSFQK